MNKRLRVILCVCVSDNLWLLPCASYRCSRSPLAVEEHLVVLSISWFVLNPKQADLRTPPPHPSHRCTKTNIALSRWLKGRSSGPPQFSSSHVGDVLARLSEQGEAALSGQRLLFWVTCQQRGRMRRGAGALEEGSAGLWERIPLAYRVVRLNESHHYGANVCQELTMWPVEGQTGQEIEVNNMVTY